MSRLIKYTLLFLVLCTAIECSSPQSQVRFQETVELPLSIKTDAVPLKATQVVSADDYIAAKKMWVYRDSILTVLNKPVKDGYFLELANLYTKEKYGSFIHYGNGPAEMLNVSAVLCNGRMLVRDFAKYQIARFDVDSVLADKSYVSTPVRYSDNAGSPSVNYLDDDRLIMLNPYYFENAEMKISNGESRFIVGEVNSKFTLLTEGGKKYYSYNVEQGDIIVNYEKDRVIFASLFCPRVEIYDCQLNPLKLLTGPDDMDIKYAIEDGSVYFHHLPYAYMGSAEAEDGVYLLYIGDFFRDEDYSGMQTFIFKFDWDGNILQSYHCDRYLHSLSLSSEENVFYCGGHDENGSNVLFKLTME